MMADDRSQTTGQFDVPQAAIDALAGFPLPDQGVTSLENYRRVLDWLYGGEVTPATLIVGLSYDRKMQPKKKNLTVLDQMIPSGSYTTTKPFWFQTTTGGTYGGRRIEPRTPCEFFESENFGWLRWTTPHGTKHVAKE